MAADDATGLFGLNKYLARLAVEIQILDAGVLGNRLRDLGPGFVRRHEGFLRGANVDTFASVCGDF